MHANLEPCMFWNLAGSCCSHPKHLSANGNYCAEVYGCGVPQAAVDHGFFHHRLPFLLISHQHASVEVLHQCILGLVAVLAVLDGVCLRSGFLALCSTV